MTFAVCAGEAQDEEEEDDLKLLNWLDEKKHGTYIKEQIQSDERGMSFEQYVASANAGTATEWTASIVRSLTDHLGMQSEG